MVKRLITGILSLTLVISVFTGCSKESKKANEPAGPTENTTIVDQSNKEQASDQNDNEQASQYGDTGGLKLPLVDKPTTVKCITSTSYPDRNDTWVIKELEKRTGIKVDIEAIPPAGYAEKVKIIVAGGNLPDMMALSQTDRDNLGMQGAVVPINRYIDQLPNFKKIIIEENPWVIKSCTAADGNLYFWPRYDCSREVNHGFLYRKDIFDKNGIKPWTNTEEFYLALKKLKELYPDSVPYSSKTKETIFKDWGYGWGLRIPVYYDESTKVWKLATTQPEYKEMLDFMKKLYNEGLLDPEFLTDTQASWTAKMTSNNSFVTFDWIGRMEMFREQVKDKMPEYDLRYAMPIGPVGKIRRINRIIPAGVSVANKENKEAALKLLDYMYSPSGAELMTMGADGETYVKDANGKITYPAFPTDKVIGISDLDEKFGLFMAGLYNRIDRRSVYFSLSEREQEAHDMMFNNDKIEVSDPILKFNDGEQEIVSEFQATLIKEGNQFSCNYIFNESFGEKEWNEWKAKAEKLGGSKLVEAYNNAQKRYDAAQ